MTTVTNSSLSGRDDYLVSGSAVRRPAWHRVSWGAVIAGVVVAIALQIVLSLLGAGLGLSPIDPTKSSVPRAATFGLAAWLWWSISSAWALFGGGWVAAHLAGAPGKTDASLHGLLTWGLATVVT